LTTSTIFNKRSLDPALGLVAASLLSGQILFSRSSKVRKSLFSGGRSNGLRQFF
jgi:hypothetical protein